MTKTDQPTTEPALDGADDLFLRWWKSQSLDSEPTRSRLIANVAFKAGMLASASVAPTVAQQIADRLNEDRCMFCGGKTAHLPDCNHGLPAAASLAAKSDTETKNSI